MRKPTILVATWGDGLFAVTSEGSRQEIARQPVRGLAPYGHGGALAIVDRHSLSMRAPSGEWETVATSEFELSCCMTVRDTIYVGTGDARMLCLSRVGVLDPIAGFDNVAGRDAWFAGSSIVNGERLGPPLGIRSVAANSNGSVLYANVHVGGIPRSTRAYRPLSKFRPDGRHNNSSEVSYLGAAVDATNTQWSPLLVLRSAVLSRALSRRLLILSTAYDLQSAGSH